MILFHHARRHLIALITLLMVVVIGIPVQPIHALRARVLTAGVPVRGSLNSTDQRDRYLFVVQYGVLITVGAFPLETSQAAPRVTIYAPNGDMVAEADLNAEKPLALGTTVDSLAAPATGAYVIEVSTTSGSGTGEYEIAAGDAAVLRVNEAGSLPPNVPTQGNIARVGDRASWTLSAAGGATITVVAQGFGSAIRPRLTVLAPDGSSLQTAPAFGSVLAAPTVTPALPTAGFTFVAPTAGDYRIWIEAEPGALPNARIGAYLITATVS